MSYSKADYLVADQLVSQHEDTKISLKLNMLSELEVWNRTNEGQHLNVGNCPCYLKL